MLALGLKIALGKGVRANAVTWVGVRFALVDRDTLVLTLPVKFMEELLALLASWKGRGMAPVKELRTVAGKAPESQVSVDEGRANRAEGVRQATQADLRSKDGLFPVKRLEQARVWLRREAPDQAGAPRWLRSPSPRTRPPKALGLSSSSTRWRSALWQGPSGSRTQRC